MPSSHSRIYRVREGIRTPKSGVGRWGASANVEEVVARPSAGNGEHDLRLPATGDASADPMPLAAAASLAPRHRGKTAGPSSTGTRSCPSAAPPPPAPALPPAATHVRTQSLAGIPVTGRVRVPRDPRPLYSQILINHFVAATS
jgi:hypothetical protein